MIGQPGNPGTFIESSPRTQKVMHKFTLSDEVLTKVSMPAGAKVVHIAVQSGAIAMWAVVDKDAERMQTRHFIVLCTGQDIPDNCHTHHATVLQGSMVYHVFEGFPQ